MARRRLNVKNLRDAAREAGDKTAYQIAKSTKLSQSTISRLLNEQVRPSAETQDRFLNTYKIPFDQLMTPDEDQQVAA